MLNNQNASFRSKFYPQKKSRMFVKQEYAMKFYAIFALVVMLLAVLRLQNDRGIVWFTLGGMVLAFLLGNLFADGQMERRVAEILFVNDSFSVITVRDAIHKGPKGRFPLNFSSPSRTDDTITFTYEDRIMTLKREDWGEEFDLVWNWFNQQGYTAS